MTQSSQDKKAQVQAYFSRTAESYVASFSHRAGNDMTRLLEIGEWQPTQHALDVATGGGHTALAVAPHVAHITVSDLTPRMLEQARSYLSSQGVTNADYEVADAEQLPFADASFDRVTCRIAPHHFPNVAQAVKEIARVLKPQGLFLLIDSISPSDPKLDTFLNTVEKRRDSSHGRSWTLEEWHHFFTEANLQVEYEEIFRRPLQYDDWTKRSQMPTDEKAALEQFILRSDEHTQKYFDVSLHEDGHIDSFSNDVVLLKGRKNS